MKLVVPLVLLLAFTACRSGDDVTLVEVDITDTLPGAPHFDGSLSRAIAFAWQWRPLDHELRTQYVRIDRTPIYINRLFLETSPYLRRYAHSPINWFRGATRHSRQLGRLTGPSSCRSDLICVSGATSCGRNRSMTRKSLCI